MSRRSDRADPLAEAAWAHAATLGTFGYAEIATGMGFPIERASAIVRAWEAAGRVESIEPPPTVNPQRRFFRVLAVEAGAQPRARSGQENLWTAMRRLRAFTPTDLVAHAATETVKVTLQRAQAYCSSLLAAGYLRAERKAQPGKREAVYRLIRNTGPRPPMEKRVRAVIDENTDDLVLIGRPR